MNKIEIKNIDGNVIFEHEKENNTIKDTIEEAVKQGVNLSYASLKGANLRGAYLSFASLECANLSDANLSDADLSDACLYDANLSRANLIDANLSCTNLEYADLSGADLYDANLYDAVLYGAKNIPDNIPMTCPESGSFIAWKKVRNWCYDYDYLVRYECLIKLEIPADAKRCSATSKKCRCSKAKVLEITDIKTNESVKEVTNRKYDCTYRVGEMVYPDYFDENRWNECSHGIHFFMDKQDALDY